MKKFLLFTMPLLHANKFMRSPTFIIGASAMMTVQKLQPPGKLPRTQLLH